MPGLVLSKTRTRVLYHSKSQQQLSLTDKEALLWLQLNTVITGWNTPSDDTSDFLMSAGVRFPQPLMARHGPLTYFTLVCSSSISPVVYVTPQGDLVQLPLWRVRPNCPSWTGSFWNNTIDADIKQVISVGNRLQLKFTNSKYQFCSEIVKW